MASESSNRHPQPLPALQQSRELKASMTIITALNEPFRKDELRVILHFIYLTPSSSRFSANTRPEALPLSLQNGSAMKCGEPPQARPGAAQRSAMAPPGGGQGRGRGAGAGAGRAPSSLDASTMRSDIF